MKRPINFYIGALLITIVGAVATIAITKVAAKADSYVYNDAYFAPINN
jgi:hypothetical protein